MALQTPKHFSVVVSEGQRVLIAKYHIHTIAFIGALLPGLTCYACIAYAHIVQTASVFNFTALDCPSSGSTLPPVSYSIGVLEPQRFLWLAIMFMNLPSRMMLSLLTRKYYSLGPALCEIRKKIFGSLQQLYFFSSTVEISAILTLSIVDMYENFYIHAGAYVVWVLFLCASMFFNCLMHQLSGMTHNSKKSRSILLFKCAMLVIVFILALSTGFTYPYYARTCASWAYTMFSLAEYAIVGWNSLFYFLGFIEYPRTRVEMFAEFSLKSEKVDSNTVLKAHPLFL